MLSTITLTSAFTIGIAWGLYVESFLLLALIFFVIIFFIICMRNKFLFVEQHISSIIVLIIVLFCGFLYVTIKQKDFDSKYLNGGVDFRITIISQCDETKYKHKYKCVNEDGDKFIILFDKKENTIFNIGDSVHIIGNFEMADVSRNEGGFDYKNYLNSINIYGNISVTKFEKIKLRNTNAIYSLQNYILNQFKKLYKREDAAILTAMLIGDDIGISDETINIFEGAGILHLLAVSGSNVALIITMTKKILSKIVGNKYSCFFEIGCTILFIFVAGSSPSVMRAGIMAILDIISSMLVKKSNSMNNIFLSELIILLINPVTICNVGFILSFVGTIGIILLNKRIECTFERVIKNKIILESLSITLAAQIFLFPVMVFYFNEISLVSIFTNLIVVPVASVLTISSIIILLISTICYPIASCI